MSGYGITGRAKRTTKQIMKKANNVRELEVYQGAFRLQQAIFLITRGFPKEEM